MTTTITPSLFIEGVWLFTSIWPLPLPTSLFKEGDQLFTYIWPLSLPTSLFIEGIHCLLLYDHYHHLHHCSWRGGPVAYFYMTTTITSIIVHEEGVASCLLLYDHYDHLHHCSWRGGPVVYFYMTTTITSIIVHEEGDQLFTSIWPLPSPLSLFMKRGISCLLLHDHYPYLHHSL